MKIVFVLQHEYEYQEHEDTKFIGVYSTQQEAEQAISRLISQPGFRDWPNGFCIDKYPINKDHWTEGFSYYNTDLDPTNSE